MQPPFLPSVRFGKEFGGPEDGQRLVIEMKVLRGMNVGSFMCRPLSDSSTQKVTACDEQIHAILTRLKQLATPPVSTCGTKAQKTRRRRFQQRARNLSPSLAM
jgi:hypothetical protein